MSKIHPIIGFLTKTVEHHPRATLLAWLQKNFGWSYPSAQNHQSSPLRLMCFLYCYCLNQQCSWFFVCGQSNADQSSQISNIWLGSWHYSHYQSVYDAPAPCALNTGHCINMVASVFVETHKHSSSRAIHGRNFPSSCINLSH